MAVGREVNNLVISRKEWSIFCFWRINYRSKVSWFRPNSQIVKYRENLEIEAHSNVQVLQEVLRRKYEELNNMEYKVAINESIENENIELRENDLMVLLPPFAGG